MEKNPEYSVERTKNPALRHRTMQIFRFTLPGGKEGQWESFAGGGGAGTIAFTPEGKLVLVRMFRFPVQAWVTELPSGSLDPEDRDPLKACLREFAEETGYQPGGAVLLPGPVWAERVLDASLHWFVIAWDCTLTGKQNLDPVEEYQGLQVVLADPAYVLQGVLQGDRAYDKWVAYTLMRLVLMGVLKKKGKGLCLDRDVIACI